MATAETVEMGPPHPPKEESIEAFDHLATELKKTLQHLRHQTNKHELSYFALVDDLSDQQLTSFNSDNLEEVRVATSAYGKHLLGKVLLPNLDPARNHAGHYFMFRAFLPGDATTAKLHCIHMEETVAADETKKFRAIFGRDDPLHWFDK